MENTMPVSQHTKEGVDMGLFRMFAYSVSPQRTVDVRAVPIGGKIAITSELKAIMAMNAKRAGFESKPLADFAVDPQTRTNAARDHIIDLAFGGQEHATAAALALATTLSNAMDLRSSHCLFIPTVESERQKRKVVLWMFPSDEVFRLVTAGGKTDISVLNDIFSQTSHHRKAALFAGMNLKTEFLSGRILDQQANSPDKNIADFWIGRFLNCYSSITSDAGTRLLAKIIRRTFELIDSPNGKEQLNASVFAVRHSPQRRLSLSTFADRYLDAQVKEIFLRCSPNDQSRNGVFEFKREIFDEQLQFRVFQLNTGVFVSSPISQVGSSVLIRSGRTRKLSCAGTIVDEKLRYRHG